MTCKPLAGKKIAVLMESEYIPREINYYKERFTELGAQVDFMSRLWGQPSARFINDVDPLEEDRNIYEFEVNIDFQNVNLNDYAAVLMAANYCSVRLRYFEPPAECPVDPQQTRTAPAVEFFAQAMNNPAIVKGALCHGLWILTPRPDLLKGRRVICHQVVLADIANAGVIYESSPTKVVVDRDLVTAYSAHEVESYVDTIAQQITARQPEPKREYQLLF
jgi:protease I